MASTVALKGRPLATLLRQLLAADAPPAATGRPVAAAPAASGKPVTAPAAATATNAASRRLYNTEGAPLRRYDVVDESGTDSGDEYDATDDGRRLTVPFFFSASGKGFLPRLRPPAPRVFCVFSSLPVFV